MAQAKQPQASEAGWPSRAGLGGAELVGLLEEGALPSLP